jgi:hypothetical protein
VARKRLSLTFIVKEIQEAASSCSKSAQASREGGERCTIGKRERRIQRKLDRRVTSRGEAEQLPFPFKLIGPSIFCKEGFRLFHCPERASGYPALIRIEDGRPERCQDIVQIQSTCSIVANVTIFFQKP